MTGSRRGAYGLLAIPLLVGLPAATLAGAGEVVDEIEVEVISVVGDELYLDRGREDGLREGDTVRFPLAGGEVEFHIVAVAGSTSRARAVGDSLPAVGDRGRAAPSAPPDAAPPPVRDEPAAGAAAGDPAEIWDGPLLAPNAAPEERRSPFRLHGRWWLSWTEAREQGEGRDTRSAWGRTRLSLLGDDLAQAGDQVEFDGQVFHRELEPDLGDDDSTTRGRVETLAYRSSWGLDRVLAYQVGRFYGRGVPELGRHDGAEVEWRSEAGRGIGAQFGLLAPRSTEDAFGDDTSFVGYYRHLAEEPEHISGVVAYQHTWHEGENDRDLLFARGQWEPLPELDLWGSIWLDIYSGEDVKSDGIELSQLWLQGTRAFGRDHRVRMQYQELRYPEIARNEGLLPELLDDGFRRTAGISTQHRFAERYILGPRLDAWWDQEDDGLSGELELRVLDILAAGQEWRIAVFRREGRQTTSPGFVASFRQSFRSASVMVGYEQRQDDYDEWVGPDLSLDATRVWGQLDWFVGRSTSLSFLVEKDDGDDQDGLIVSGSLQYRF